MREACELKLGASLQESHSAKYKSSKLYSMSFEVEVVSFAEFE